MGWLVGLFGVFGGCSFQVRIEETADEKKSVSLAFRGVESSWKFFVSWVTVQMCFHHTAVLIIS